MREIINIAVDAGKRTAKSVTKIDGKMETYSFRNKVQKVNNLGISIPHQTYHVTLMNESYLVGAAVREGRIPNEVSKKSIEHLVCIYLSVAHFVQIAGGNVVNLVVGMPQNLYKNKTLKEEFANYIKGTGVISLEINNTATSFIINKVLIVPEGVGSIYSDISKHQHGRYTVIDIGGLNVNYGHYKNLVPTVDMMLVNNMGTSALRASISDRLSEKYGVYLSIDEGDEVMQDGYFCMDGIKMSDSISLIKTIKEEHVAEIINYSKGHGLPLFSGNSQVMFTGGGSLLLQDIISELYPSALFSPNPQYANVLSFLAIQEVKNEKSKTIH